MDRLEHRKGKAVLHFQDREGKPLAGKAVEVRQKKQEFLFGCNAFDTLELCRENLDGQRRAASSQSRCGRQGPGPS